MVVQLQKITVNEFDDWILLPENVDRDFEYIGGDVVEVVSHGKSSNVAVNIAAFIKLYLLNNPIGWLTGADGGYMIGDQRYIPDVAFMSHTKQTNPPDAAYNPVSPDLAVEVISPSDSPAQLATKVTNYLLAGVVVWVADPGSRTIAVHTSGKAVDTFGVDDTLTGGDVLPGFEIAVQSLFES
jgi:Uma2 family endonuclease